MFYHHFMGQTSGPMFATLATYKGSSAFSGLSVVSITNGKDQSMSTCIHSCRHHLCYLLMVDKACSLECSKWNTQAAVELCSESTFSFTQLCFLSRRSSIMSFCSCCRLFFCVNLYVSGHISHQASFINTSRASWNVVGPTARYWSTNFKYLPNSTVCCTLTQREVD